MFVRSEEKGVGGRGSGGVGFRKIPKQGKRNYAYVNSFERIVVAVVLFPARRLKART